MSDLGCTMNPRRDVVRLEGKGKPDDAHKSLAEQLLANGALVIRLTEATNATGEKYYGGRVSLVLTLEDYHVSREILIERLMAYADAKGLIHHLPSNDVPAPYASSLLDCLVASDGR